MLHLPLHTLRRSDRYTFRAHRIHLLAAVHLPIITTAYRRPVGDKKNFLLKKD